MATPNYGYEKRQRELAKKKKKEEKLKAKAAGKRYDDPDAPEGQPADDADTNDAAAASGEGPSHPA
ncbi:hypothetical protein [Hydrogenophaga sp.]|uniref:hypothetical protein n=1 Tax=Hydrogenophaga sp. TaxID=1904254 RepID=UPI003F6C3795